MTEFFRFLTLSAVLTLVALITGCAVAGDGYYDDGGEWDGGVWVGGIYEGGGHWDRDHDHHGPVFHDGDGHRAGFSSARGNASMGSHGGGGGGHVGGGGGGGGGGGHR